MKHTATKEEKKEVLDTAFTPLASEPTVTSGDGLTCDWSQDYAGDRWTTDCGKVFLINEGLPIENGMSFAAFAVGHWMSLCIWKTPEINTTRTDMQKSKLKSKTTSNRPAQRRFGCDGLTRTSQTTSVKVCR